jgi:hypothetical protein
MTLMAALCCASGVQAQQMTSLNANGPGETYELVNSVFGSGAASEVPDCFHNVRHIREDWDSTLSMYVFLFDIHIDSIVDNDRCTNYDRQRNEIKTVSPSSITGQPGELHVYRWKFKIDSLFQPSPNFCHLHQIKATGGTDDGAPLMTITPRKYSDTTQPEWLQLIFTPSTGGSGAGTLKQVELQPLKGLWLDVTEKVTYSDEGKYEVTIRKLDSTIVMHYSNFLLDMYRDGANFHRGKWGIYRSLNSQSYLRDETVAFADFLIVEGEPHSTPDAPDGLQLTVVDDHRIDLSWADQSSNETNFQVQRSANGTQWSTVGIADSNSTSYSNTGLASGTKYYYRVRAENWNAASAYTDTVSATTSGIPSGIDEGSILPEDLLLLRAYPNPFNPSTTLTYRLPSAGRVRLAVFNVIGQEIAVIANENQAAGGHRYQWDATGHDGRALNGGVYFAALSFGNTDVTTKLVVLK